MNRVLACIDLSSYANSVCDHAGWFASDPDVGVEVLHVVEPVAAEDQRSVDPLLQHAISRLREQGIGPLTQAHAEGPFVDVAAGRQANLIVMGKRGDRSEAERRRLGSNVDAMVRRTSTPICLTSKVFLPIHRVLVLMDGDLDHRAALEFVTADPRLNALPVDIVVVAGSGGAANPKIAWARARLNRSDADVFSLQAEDLDAAVTQYLQSRAADLLVVSRTVLTPAPEARLELIAEQGLWGARTPVLVC